MPRVIVNKQPMVGGRVGGVFPIKAVYANGALAFPKWGVSSNDVVFKSNCALLDIRNSCPVACMAPFRLDNGLSVVRPSSTVGAGITAFSDYSTGYLQGGMQLSGFTPGATYKITANVNYSDTTSHGWSMVLPVFQVTNCPIGSYVTHYTQEVIYPAVPVGYSAYVSYTFTVTFPAGLNCMVKPVCFSSATTSFLDQFGLVYISVVEA